MKQKNMKEGGTMKYICDWCRHEFTKHVVYDEDKKYSTVIVCPKCARTIPTWNVERTGNVVGITHIHTNRK